MKRLVLFTVAASTAAAVFVGASAIYISLMAPPVPELSTASLALGDPHPPTVVAARARAAGVETRPDDATHVHVNLVWLVSGEPFAVPAGVGIAQTASGVAQVMALHTHEPDGVIHVESPEDRLYTLGDFMAVWGVSTDTDRLCERFGVDLPCQVAVSAASGETNGFDTILTDGNILTVAIYHSA